MTYFFFDFFSRKYTQEQRSKYDHFQKKAELDKKLIIAKMMEQHSPDVVFFFE
jgi:hypothetical protein